MASMHWEGEGSESIMPSQEGTSLEATQSGYCDSCPFGRPPNRREVYYRGLTVDYEAMKESAQRGHCQACAGIVEFLKAQEQEPIKLVYRDDDYNGMLLSLVLSEEGSYPAYEFFVKNEEPAGGINPRPYWDDAFGEIDWMRTPSGDTCNTAAFETLSRWISRCKAEHTKCQPRADKTLPHRVLEIVETEPLRIQLVENCTQQADYACLSHRWGTQTKPNSLIQENLDLYRAGIAEANLYPLVRDAIGAIIRLGLRFIWIDCYCIIQDDPVDWEAEAANMASIYENAVLTISATFSENGCSMFSTMSKEFEEFQITQIRGVPIYIRKQLPHPCIMEYGEMGSLVQESFHGSSLTRGWVFQERLLSSRFIHFTSSEIFWECRESTWCECGSREPHWAGHRKREARTIDEQSWDLIADQFNGTQLSFEKDRLPALAGVARRYGELHGGLTYLAGLWQEELPAALAWFKPGGHREERPLEKIAPSWSWASLPRGMILLMKTRESFVRVVGVRINPPGADVYMSAKWAELTVEGPTMDLEVYKHSDGVMIGRHGNGFLKIQADFKTDPDDDTKFRSVPDGSSCLLLLMLDDSEETYYIELYGIVLLQQSSGADGEDPKFERIGYFGANSGNEIFYVDNSGDYEYCGGDFPSAEDSETDDGRGPPIQWFLDRAETRQVTLI